MVHARTIETARGPASYLEAGSGWPVVLIHAFPLSAEMWRPQLERVPEGWRFIAPHLAGFGPVPPRTGPASLDDYARDVEALLDALRIDTAVIGGLSMGGYITLALHRCAPERFTGVILADTKAEADTAEGRAGRQAMSELVQTKGPSAVADSMLPKLLSRTSRNNPEIAAMVRGLIEANRAEGIDRAIHAMMERPDSTPHLSRLSVPVLVLVGEEDSLTPRADSERMQRAILRSRLVVLEGAAHLSSLDAPAPFSTAVTAFLTSAM